MINKFQKQREHKINSEVRYPLVKLVGQGDPKVLSSYEASKLAQSMNKDLILINENQDPPIVKIDEYNKFIYDIEKREKERKKNSTKNEIKEMQLSCEIATHDLETKSKKSIEFLQNGSKVKCVISLKGRQKAMPEKGELVMLRFAEMLSIYGQPESFPSYNKESSKWIMIVKPLLKKK